MFLSFQLQSPRCNLLSLDLVEENSDKEWGDGGEEDDRGKGLTGVKGSGKKMIVLEGNISTGYP